AVASGAGIIPVVAQSVVGPNRVVVLLSKELVVAVPDRVCDEPVAGEGVGARAPVQLVIAVGGRVAEGPAPVVGLGVAIELVDAVFPVKLVVAGPGVGEAVVVVADENVGAFAAVDLVVAVVAVDGVVAAPDVDAVGGGVAAHSVG